MALSDTTLVCEGQPMGRDIRWLGLAIDALGFSARFDVVPCGSKVAIRSTVLGLREALHSPRIYGLRDRDYLPQDRLQKDLTAGVCTMRRHCLESYLIEPQLVETALAIEGVGAILESMALARSFADVTRAAFEEVAFLLRDARPSLGDQRVASREEAIQVLDEKLTRFHSELPRPGADVLIDRFYADMSQEVLWTRVDGKQLMVDLEAKLRSSVLPGGNLEGRLFKWCAENGPPQPFVAEVKLALETLGLIELNAP